MVVNCFRCFQRFHSTFQDSIASNHLIKNIQLAIKYYLGYITFNPYYCYYSSSDVTGSSSGLPYVGFL